MKRIQIYIEDEMDEVLGRRARQERRSKASLIREAVSREYAEAVAVDPFDAWAGGIDDVSGDVDEVVYRQ